MGTEEFYRFETKENSVKACADMLIVATAEHVAAVVEADNRHSFPNLATFGCSNDEPIPANLIAAAQVLVVEVDPAMPRSIERLIELGRRYPGLPRIAAIANGSVPLVRTLVHEGVADVVSLPFQIEELLDASLGALAAVKAQAREQLKLAPLISVVGSIGGCGASSIATHLACEIASQTGSAREMAVVDFDLQSGTVAEYLGCSGHGSIADLLAAGDRLDEELVESIAQPTEHRASVFAAPPDIEPLENVETDLVLGLLGMMRRRFAGVVIDLPADWTNWTLSAVSSSDLVVMVVELSVNSLRQAKRRLQLFESVGIDRGKVVLLVNRVERRLFKAIDLSDVAATLDRDVIGSLAVEEPGLSSAQAQGLLARSVSRKSKFSDDIAKVASDLVDRLAFVGD